MGKLVVLAGIVALTALAAAQSEPAPITAAAVWHPAGDFLAKAHAACDKVSPSEKFADCVINQMPAAGAPADAVTFTRQLYRQIHEVGVMAGFHKVGPVDIAWVSYPLRSTNGLLLVNGSPRIIDAEDIKLLDLKGMQQSFQFQDLQNSFPRVNVWPGDRNGNTWPNSQTGSNGGLQFIIGYPLRNGCQTCAHAGFALFTWNFSSTGRFMGTNFLGMTPAPVAGQSPAAPPQ